MNNVILIGRPGKEPETRTTPSGAKVVTISLGVDRRTKDNKKETDWIDCTAWGKTADFVEGYVKKGERICIQGQLQTRTWQDQNGQNRKIFFVLVDKCELLGDRRSETAPTPPPTAPTVPPTVAPSTPEQFEQTDGELPFQI